MVGANDRIQFSVAETRLFVDNFWSILNAGAGSLLNGFLATHRAYHSACDTVYGRDADAYRGGPPGGSPAKYSCKWHWPRASPGRFVGIGPEPAGVTIVAQGRSG